MNRYSDASGKTAPTAGLVARNVKRRLSEISRRDGLSWGTPEKEISTMADSPATIAEIDEQIAIVRENLRDLVEQAAAYSGAANEELVSQRIADQQAQLDLLTKRRDELARQKS
jgi:hypothetical protein